MILRKYRYAAFAAFAVAAGLCLPATGRAQTDAPAEAQAENAPPTDEKISLKDVLAKARIGRVGIALAVGAENITRTKKELDGQDVETVDHAAAAFGMTKRDFGQVMMAIGPQTYIELTTDFRNKNIFADMPPDQAFTLLLATLDDRQRNALTGKTGLGLSDLTTLEQKNLFKALLPDQEVSVSQQDAPAETPKKNLGVLRDQASSIHIRVAQRVSEIDYSTSSDILRGINRPVSNGDPYHWDFHYESFASDVPKMNGIVIQHEVPNVPKRNDLYNELYASRLQVAIPIKDLDTVGDLMAIIAKRTGIKLYADARYEDRSLTWITNGKNSASAASLLRAVAFCLPATYRRVGTAFVLTESLEGAGTRLQMIYDFNAADVAKRNSAINTAKKTLETSIAQRNTKLRMFDDSLALTPDQEKNTVTAFGDFNDDYTITEFTFDQLTAKQQEVIQKYAKKPQYSNLDFEGKFKFYNVITAQILVPGLNGVIDTSSAGGLLPLFHPEPLETSPSAEEWKRFISECQNLPKWKDAAKPYACRAIICRPHTTADVDAALARISGTGFNQMWPVVFENGKAEIPGTPFPLDPACDPKTDILTYAIAEGRKKGITICPVVNIYGWGADAPAELRLRTLRGEDSKESAVRRAEINRFLPSTLSIDSLSPDIAFLNARMKILSPSPVVFVDPTSPAIQKNLIDFFKTLSAHTGVEDWICRSLFPKGFGDYTGDREMGYPNHLCGGTGNDMGYNVGLRQKFLEEFHCDPIDLGISYDDLTDKNLLIPTVELTNFDTGKFSNLAWLNFCAENLQKSLASLFDAALRNCGDKKPRIIYARPVLRSWADRFEVWNGPDTPFPDRDIFDGASDPPIGNKSIPSGDRPAFYFLSKEPEGIRPLLPKELQKVDWRDFQMRALEMLKPYRKWEGIVIEE